MTFSVIKVMCKSLKNNGFSGHVKFGVEHGGVINFVKESVPPKNNVPENEIELVGIADEINAIDFGKVELDFIKGRIVDYVITESVHSSELEKLIEAERCRYVKIAAK